MILSFPDPADPRQLATEPGEGLDPSQGTPGPDSAVYCCGDRRLLAGIIAAAPSGIREAAQSHNTGSRRLRYPGLRQVLAGLSPVMRTRVGKAWKAATGEAHMTPLNPERRAALSEVLFSVQDDLETRRPGHPQARALNRCRCRLYEDLGIDEPLSLRQGGAA